MPRARAAMAAMAAAMRGRFTTPRLPKAASGGVAKLHD
jgi:hypothetical protein